MSKGLDFGLFIGLPKTLTCDNGARMQGLFSIQGRDKQDALITKALAGFERGCTTAFGKHLIGRFSAKNKHRIKQALPYLAWSYSRSVGGLMDSYSVLPSNAGGDTNALGLPHLLILDHLGYLDLDNKCWTDKKKLSVRDGAVAYAKILTRQHFVGWPGVNDKLGVYAVWWPYLLVAMAKLSDMAAQWDTSTEAQHQQILELYWAVVVICQIKESWAYGPHMAQAFMTDNRNSAISGLIEDSFGLPEKDFSSLVFGKNDIKNLLIPELEFKSSDVNYIVAGKKFSSANYTLFWSSMLRELASFYRQMSEDCIHKQLSTPGASVIMNMNPENADLLQKPLTLQDYTYPERNADEQSWQRNILVDHVACMLLKDMNGALEQATAQSTWRSVFDCATLKMRDIVKSREEAPEQRTIGQFAIITEPRLLDCDIEAISYSVWLSGYKYLCDSLEKIAELQKNDHPLLKFNNQHNLSEQICALWRGIGVSLFNQVSEPEAAGTIKPVIDSLKLIAAMPHSADRAALQNAATQMISQLENNPIHNDTAIGLIELNRLYQVALNSDISDEQSKDSNISAQWELIDAKAQSMVASVSAYHDQSATDGEPDMEDAYQPLTKDVDLEQICQRNADQAARIKTLQAKISERNIDLKKSRDINKRLQKQIQERGLDGGIAVPRPADTIINSNSALVKGLLATIDSDEPAAVLRLAERFCQGALVITPNALETAKQYRRSEYSPEALLSSLLKLAIDYLPLYREGGDTLARNVFGASYRAGESDVVLNNDRLRQQRLFDVGGEKKLVTAHIAVNLFLRVYFHVDQNSNNVAVTYCGRHLECACTN